jgi:hypothetical protein
MDDVAESDDAADVVEIMVRSDVAVRRATFD